MMKFNNQKVEGQLQCDIITFLVFSTITQDQEERLWLYFTFGLTLILDAHLEIWADSNGLL